MSFQAISYFSKMKKRVLVTGGSGYIGSHTAVELLAAGYEVIIADNLSNSSADVVERVEKISGQKVFFEQIDFSNKAESAAFFDKYPSIDAIIHFAAYKAVGESVEKPLMYYHNNLLSLLHVLEGMQKHEIPALVFSSSATVYGQPDLLPVTESAPFQPANSPYGNTKQIAEEIIRDTSHAVSGLKAIALRYFNPIGAHPSALIGELPLGVPNNLVPFITQTSAGLRKELIVFGDDYNTPDGSAIRDYIHVVDLAKAHVKAIDRLLRNSESEAFEFFNLGTGTGVSVFEVIHTFERVNQLKLNYRISGRRIGDVEQVWADTKKANEVLNWQAGCSLNEALRSAWEWEKYYRNVLAPGKA
jgi:UDP-glucose 4-epimerase